ncbi:triple tyrosine motif-containing protein [Clostridium tunisiense]|uniref:triple tyrosine motif-containing protein n=1 Tax=Clostridium tunisiense TaxID=219748 RepID=UPI00030B049F|nr:triple tyrosine motif-containing protein [Clostridium tunisiense]
MNEMNIITSLESPQEKNKEIKISIENKIEDGLLYKFLIGNDGKWSTLKDFHRDSYALWSPKEDGKYMIMVHAKREGSKKSHDYTSKVDFIIGTIEEKLIKHITLDKTEGKIGEKINVTVEPNTLPVMYRYWIKEEARWHLIKDYSIENTLAYTAKVEGEFEILVECKKEHSSNIFDDFASEKFKVLPVEKVEIRNFKCLCEELLVGEELTFEVEAAFDESRTILYKFIKLHEDGNAEIVQDFSTKRLVSFSEGKPGKYKLLCVAKDMYSQSLYDDRAVMNYKVDLYRPIKVLSITSDLSSPQVENTPITLKGIAIGGKNLRYKFIVDGNDPYSSEYQKENVCIWTPKKSGKYIIELLVKDESFSQEFEARETMEFTIEEDFIENVIIEDIVLDKKKYLLINEPVNIKVAAKGGLELMYEFIVTKDEEVIDKLEYSEYDWVDFTPEEVGEYKLEVRVKDRRSKREYDVHSIVYIQCREYVPAKIDYILTENKKLYLVGDSFQIEVIAENTKNTLVQYKVKINGHEVEETEFSKEKKFKLTPKCAGEYEIDIYARNLSSTKNYDAKKQVRFIVAEAPPINNCRINTESKAFKCNEAVNFTVGCDGGKDIVYEFYLMEKGEWKVIQKYSKKNYYTFIPFTKGYYKLLALCKSSFSKLTYEDYHIVEIEVNE